MNKNTEYFVLCLSTGIKHELKAYAFQMGLRGRASTAARKLILEGLQKYKDGMTPKERSAFGEIIANVEIAALVEPKKDRGKQKSTYIKKKQRGGI
jgi:hypothetical protein